MFDKILCKFGKYLCKRYCVDCKEEVNKWKSNIKDTEKITKEKIDFVYGNAIDYLKEIDNGMSVINTRTTLLLTYLASIVAFLVNVIIKAKVINFAEYNAIAIVVEYIVIIFYITYHLILPRLGFSTQNEPKNFLTNDCFQYNYEIIKFFECENMQERINSNLKTQSRILTKFKYSIYFTFGFPIISFLCFLFFIKH